MRRRPSGGAGLLGQPVVERNRQQPHHPLTQPFDRLRRRPDRSAHGDRSTEQRAGGGVGYLSLELQRVADLEIRARDNDARACLFSQSTNRIHGPARSNGSLHELGRL